MISVKEHEDQNRARVLMRRLHDWLRKNSRVRGMTAKDDDVVRGMELDIDLLTPLVGESLADVLQGDMAAILTLLPEHVMIADRKTLAAAGVDPVIIEVAQRQAEVRVAQLKQHKIYASDNQNVPRG